MQTLSTLENKNSDNLLYYLLDTRKTIQANPKLYSSIQNYENLIQMFNYAIEYWNTEKRIQALQLLSNQEKELIKKGLIFSENKDDNKGFFTSILDNLQGFGKIGDRFKENIEKWKENKEERKENREENREERIDERNERGGVVHDINKFNPVTVTMRNSFRALLALNFLGFSTILSTNSSKNKEVLKKVVELFKKFGGEEDKLMQSIETGKTKKAIFNKKLQEEIEKQNISGFGELGVEPVTTTTAGLVASAMAMFAPLLKWIKDAGLFKGNEEVSQNNEVVPQNNVTQSTEENVNNTNSRKLILPLVIGAICVAGIGGIVYYYYNNKASSQKLKGITFQ